jgi:tripartite-type tricarboxylate transporter receptor subunit TctC
MFRHPAFRRRGLLAAAAGLLALVSGEPASAQGSYPDRPIRLIVPFAPGGGSDIVARITAACMSTGLGQQVVVENRAGAGGTIGADAVAKAAPDGYTLVLHTLSSAVLNVFLYNRLPYDPRRDFVPVAEIGRAPNILAVRRDLPARSVAELLDLARREPGRINYGSGGNGTIVHLSAVLLANMANIALTHVPFRGGGPSMNALVAGQVDMMIDAVPVLLPQVREGSVRALAVTSPERVGLLPDVPTVAESGLAGYETQNWYGIYAPGRTPRPVIDRLATEVARVVADPDCGRRLVDLGVNLVGSGPDAFRAHWERELEVWGPIIRASGARLD